MLDLEEQHELEEDMWQEGEGYTGREERTYAPTEKDRTEQENRTRRDTVNWTGRNAGVARGVGALGIPEITRARKNSYER